MGHGNSRTGRSVALNDASPNQYPGNPPLCLRILSMSCPHTGGDFLGSEILGGEIFFEKGGRNYVQDEE